MVENITKNFPKILHFQGALTHIFDKRGVPRKILSLFFQNFSVSLLTPNNTKNHTLIILTEQELLAYDIVQQKEIQPPYLQSLGYSQITEATTSYFTTKIKSIERDNFIKSNYGSKNVVDLSIKKSTSSELSSWPINGGIHSDVSSHKFDILSGHQQNLSPISYDKNHNAKEKYRHNEFVLTGHANGQVKIFNSKNLHLSLSQTLNTAQYFAEYDPPLENRYEFISEKLPLKNIGIYDPYLDDERFQISRICMSQDILVTGSRGGQVCIFGQNLHSKKPIFTKIDLRPENEKTGNKIKIEKQNPLTFNGVRKNTFGQEDAESLYSNHRSNFAADSFTEYKLMAVIQILPSTRISNLNIQNDWALISIGCAYGFVLYDYRQHTDVIVTKTMSSEVAELAADYQTPFGRSMRSLNKSLRSSLKSLRNSFRKTNTRGGLHGTPNSKFKSRTPRRDNNTLKPWTGARRIKIEQPGKDQNSFSSVYSGVVRFSDFITANISSTDYTDQTFMVGTQGGAVYIYLLDIPDYNDRGSKKVDYHSAKFLQLQHKAAVIGVSVSGGDQHQNVDSERGNSFARNNTLLSQNSPSLKNQILTVVSEEQIKTFALPGLRFLFVNDRKF